MSDDNVFRVESINISKSVGCHTFYVEVTFFRKEKGAPWFGQLGKYARALYVPDIEALEKFEEEEAEKEFPFIFAEAEDHGVYEVIGRTRPSPFDLGLIKIVDVEGADLIQDLGEDRYRYSQHLQDCSVVCAAIEQLDKVKRSLETGVYEHGFNPRYSGDVRIEDIYHEFIGLLETLDRFWD